MEDLELSWVEKKATLADLSIGTNVKNIIKDSRYRDRRGVIKKISKFNHTTVFEVRYDKQMINERIDPIMLYNSISFAEDFVISLPSASKANTAIETNQVAINDYVCPTCGNEKCSKNEKTCWKCGNPL